MANGLEIHETTAFVDVLGWAASFGSEPIETVTATIRANLTCTFAHQIIPSTKISEVETASFDALAIPGGFQAAGFYEETHIRESY